MGELQPAFILSREKPMPMPMPTPISASLASSSPLPQWPLLPLLLLQSPLLPMLLLSPLAPLSQSVFATRCQWRAHTRLLARFASQSHRRCAQTWRSPCPGKFAPRLLSPSPHPPLPLPLLLLLSLEVLVLLGLLGSIRCQRC